MCDLYGFKTNDLDRVAKEMEKALGILFEMHDSLFRGGDYYYSMIGTPWKEELILQRNAELEDEFAEPDFTEYPIIFYACAKEPNRLIEIRGQLLKSMRTAPALLRSEK